MLAAAPWLRSFPVSVAGAPLYGAAVLSVLVPIAMARLRPNWLWAGIVVDVVVFVFYGLFVVLQEPINFVDLVQGLYRGPSQVLTFALPLVSPRSLMLAPAALIWVCGALAGECLARRWYTLLPYVGFLVSFGLSYAATQRAAGSELLSARHRETILAGDPARHVVAHAGGAGMGAAGRVRAEHPARRHPAAARSGDRHGHHARRRAGRGAGRAERSVPEALQRAAAGAIGERLEAR